MNQQGLHSRPSDTRFQHNLPHHLRFPYPPPMPLTPNRFGGPPNQPPPPLYMMGRPQCIPPLPVAENSQQTMHTRPAHSMEHLLNPRANFPNYPTITNYGRCDSFSFDKKRMNPRIYENPSQNQISNWENCQYTTSSLTLEKASNELSVEQKTAINDEKSVAEWLNNKTWTKVQNNNTVKIPEAKCLLKDACKMIKDLKYIYAECEKYKQEQHIKHELMNKANELKKNLECIKKYFTSDVIKSLYEKVLSRKKYRERKKRGKKRKFEEKIETDENRKKMHEQIDKWQNKIYEEVQEKKREKELKSIADKTLNEVQQKLNDAKKAYELLESLKKLRNVRKNTMERKGLYTSKESDILFDIRIEKQQGALKKQLDSYEAERKLLQVMLDTEQEEIQEYEAQERKRMKEEKEAEMQHKIEEVLFGKLRGPPSTSSAIYRFYMYQDAANQSVEELVRIRHDWDKYLVGAESEGSVLPPVWVTPTEPSSDIWASALQRS